MNIAVCDDEEIQRSLLKGYLEAWAEAGSHALRISLFSTGRQFLESLKETRFDIVLLDIQMPDMDGMSAAKALRETDGQTRRKSAIWKPLPTAASCIPCRNASP